LFGGRAQVVHLERLGQRVGDIQPRRQAAAGIAAHKLQAAAQGAQTAAPGARNISALKPDPAAGWFFKPCERARELGFASAARPQHSHLLARHQGQADLGKDGALASGVADNLG
jgi:hypothetical protein